MMKISNMINIGKNMMNLKKIDDQHMNFNNMMSTNNELQHNED